MRDRKLFTLEDAVRRMTQASAERFGLEDIGSLTPGKAADLVLFDPREITDKPGQDRQPAGRPEGIRQIFINGQTVVKDGKYVESVRPGRVLKALDERRNGYDLSQPVTIRIFSPHKR